MHHALNPLVMVSVFSSLKFLSSHQHIGICFVVLHSLLLDNKKFKWVSDCKRVTHELRSKQKYMRYTSYVVHIILFCKVSMVVFFPICFYIFITLEHFSTTWRLPDTFYAIIEQKLKTILLKLYPLVIKRQVLFLKREVINSSSFTSSMAQQ